MKCNILDTNVTKDTFSKQKEAVIDGLDDHLSPPLRIGSYDEIIIDSCCRDFFV